MGCGRSPALTAHSVDPRAIIAQQRLAEAGLDLGESIDDQQAIVTAILLERRPERVVRQRLRKAPDLSGDLLFRARVSHGSVAEIALVEDDIGDPEWVRRLARRLGSARCGADVSAEVLLPVPVRRREAAAVSG